MSYPITPRSRARRRPQRASYDRAAVHAVLDASLLCHVGYVIDGQPFVTPTAFWREGEHVYWHGSAASRMIRAVDGQDVCVTVSHLDGLVLARSAFHHSVNYRSAMLFGRAEIVREPAAKAAAMRAFIERIYPGRSAAIRESSEKELKASAVVRLTIAEAVAKVRNQGPVEEPEDYAVPVWAGVIPFVTTAGAPVPDTDLRVPDAAPPYAAAHAGERVDAVLAATAAVPDG